MKQPSLVVLAASLVAALAFPSAALAEDKAVMTSSPGQATIAQKRRLVATGGAVAEHVKVTADVTAVDQKTHMVTLKGPKQEVDLYVADPAQLKLIKVGDQIEAEYTQALAITVEPAKK